jgi:hypothetical protein
MKKYKLLKKSKIEFRGKTLFQIQALKDFGYISKGEKGGFVESEVNLSQEGDSWITGGARVGGDARISDNARVSGSARVLGSARVFGDAWKGF